MRRSPLLGIPAVFAAGLFASCSGSGAGPDGGADAAHDARVVEASVCPTPAAGSAAFCDLPGSIVYAAGGARCVVAGGPAAPSLAWMTLPSGYCAHYFAHVQTARQIRAAPGGELFVASPSTYTAGGAPTGMGAIVVLHDDDGDGFADGDALPHADNGPQSLPQFAQVASVQGLAFAPGAFYYQDGAEIMKAPYTSGQRSPSGAPVPVVDVTVYESEVHWPKTLDVADDGTIFLGNGGDQSEQCNANVFPRPFHGGILGVDGTKGGTPVAQGFRNPIAVRCQRGHDLCFAAELGLDGSGGGGGGREKIVPIRKGDDWGFPCCATTDVAYDDISGSPDCSRVATEEVALEIGDTPFGLDFEPGTWPAPYTKSMLVTLHGQVGSWVGARVLAVPIDDATGMPVRSSDLDASTIPDFATGWDDGSQSHGRPAAVTFGADGRAYVANDWNGDIFWIAPIGASKAQ